MLKHLRCYPRQCVWHAFRGHLLAGWGGSRHRQSLPGLVQTQPDIVASHCWVSTNLTAQKSHDLLLLCRRMGQSLLLEFWPLCLEQRQLPLQRATCSPHHLEYLKVMPRFSDVRENQVWRNLAEEGNKGIYPCYVCLKKSLQKLPYIC